MSFRVGFTVAFITSLWAATAASPAAFNLAEMQASAARMGSACTPERWNSNWLGNQSQIRTYPAISISGTDLAFYKVNAEPAINHLYRMNARALRSGDTSALKAFFMGMVTQNHFTKLTPFVPKTWEGKTPAWLRDYGKYNALDEASFSASILLIAAAQSYGVLKPGLSAAEKKAINAWGKKIYRNAKSKGSKASDAKAVRAAGFTTWGAVSGDSPIFSAGVSLFGSVVSGIGRDGRDKYFSKPTYAGRELKYFHMTYGFLSVAAWAIEKNGGKAFRKTRGGGSLIDGLNFHLEMSFYPDRRTRISRQQEVRYLKKSRAVTASTLSFIEFVRDAGITNGEMPLLDKALGYRNRGGNGFYSGYYGGYSTCIVGG